MGYEDSRCFFARWACTHVTCLKDTSTRFPEIVCEACKCIKHFAFCKYSESCNAEKHDAIRHRVMSESDSIFKQVNVT